MAYILPGPPSKIRRPDFLKTPEYHQGLELDIPYYDYGFAIEQARDQLKKELCKENWITLRESCDNDDPKKASEIIDKHLQDRNFAVFDFTKPIGWDTL
ncbi:unnamed protein product [Rhizophagus irregularis]|nr:unnamed protein product [Rhizophagus irregularis]